MSQKPAKHSDTKVSRKTEPNPYMDARREWNERYGSYIAAASNWRIAFMGILVICLVETAGLVVLATQSKLVPYVVEVDKLGTPIPVSRAEKMNEADPRVVKALLARFVADVRGVVSDGIAQRQMIDRTYAMLSNGTRALSVINDYYKGEPPFARAASAGVSIDISSAIQISPQTWQIDWEETTRSTAGAIVKKVRWKASLTIAFNPPTTEAQIRVNPVGVFITDLNWSQVL